MATFDLKELVAKAHFDYVGPAFPLWWKNNKTKFLLPGLKLLGFAKPGQKYFTTVSLGYNGERFDLPNEPLISFSIAKTIVETATVGRYRKGTVKEYITTEDYQITIKGICIDEENYETYPTEQVDMIRRMFEINDALEVIDNPFLELFEIRKLVIKDLQLDEMVGQQGLQKYTITAVSDQDFYADLREKDLQNLFANVRIRV
jgi:Domain of unknown function (DUF6046)